MTLVYLWLSPVLVWSSFMDRPSLAMLLCPALAWSSSMDWLFLVLWASFAGEMTSATLITCLCYRSRFTAYKWVSLTISIFSRILLISVQKPISCLTQPRMLKAGCHELLPLWCGLDAQNDVAKSGDPENNRKVRPASRAIAFVAVLQAGARFQLTYLVIMGAGLASLSLLMIEWLSASFRTTRHTGIFWPLLLWALYFGVLSKHLADRATKYQASCA